MATNLPIVTSQTQCPSKLLELSNTMLSTDRGHKQVDPVNNVVRNPVIWDRITNVPSQLGLG